MSKTNVPKMADAPPMPAPMWPFGGKYNVVDMQARDAQWQQRITLLAAALTEVCGCFDAAEAEGLTQALAETTDMHLKDLVERRLMFAQAAARIALENTHD